MTILAILTKAVMPCVVAATGVTVGVVGHAPIKRAIHRVYHRPVANPKPAYKPAAIVAPSCIMPVMGDAPVVALPAPDAVPMGVTENGFWWIGKPPTPGVVVVTPPAPPTGIPAVPEPATWGMMIVGVAGVGAAIRRHRKQEQPA